MLESLDQQLIDYNMSHLNTDSGFDVLAFINFIEKYKIVANIKQNK